MPRRCRAATRSRPRIRQSTFTPGATFVTLGSQTLTATDISNATITGSKTTTVGSGPATQLVVGGLANTSLAGVAQSVTVTAKDAFGNTATGYTGADHVTSSDGASILPADYSFLAGDAGLHTSRRCDPEDARVAQRDRHRHGERLDHRASKTSP